ncbi:MAG: SSU ribosomal protein S12p (S23e), partial [uncultured Nocardioides sp.]
AHHQPAGPQGPPGQGVEEQDACPEGISAAPWRLHPRLHHHPQEAELRPPQGRPRATEQRRRGHRLHPGCRSQPPGALDRARPRRPGEGPPRCPLQDHPRLARHPGCQEPQAGPQPLRREEGEV